MKPWNYFQSDASRLVQTSSGTNAASFTSNSIARPIQSNLITRYIPKPVGASRRKVIDQKVVKMIVKEYFSFSVVEDREFIKLISMLNSGYTLPSRKIFTTSLLPVMYNEVYEKVSNDVTSNDHYVSLTTDSWTSVKNESHTAETVHFIDDDCTLKTYL